MASRRTEPLQRTHGLGVSPASWSRSHGSTTPARNSARRSSVKCARPMPWASARAERTALAEQHDASESFSGEAHSSSVTATASPPHSSAATARCGRGRRTPPRRRRRCARPRARGRAGPPSSRRNARQPWVVFESKAAQPALSRADDRAGFLPATARMPSLRTRILLPIVALVLAGVVYGAAAIQRSTATRAADRVQTAQDLLTGMLDQETGLRGFLLSGRSGFLAPYVAGARRYEEALSLAHAQLAGNRDAARAVARADAIAERWRVLAEYGIADTRAVGVHRQTRGALLQRKRLMDAFRAADHTLHATLVTQREHDQRLALWLSAGLSLPVFLLVGGVGTLGVTRGVRAQMAAARADNESRASQAEFVQTLQAVDTEREANVLLQRHIRQWTPDREVVVANRNNSDNRLETSADGDGALREALDGAEPRQCVAIRLGRAHEERSGEQGLLSCELCGASGDALCSPLVISGRVIGSVAVRPSQPVLGPTRPRIAHSGSP